MNAGLNAKIKAACSKDPSIVVKADSLENYTGYSEQYFAFLGLDTGDLKSLLAKGFARKGQITGPNGGLQNRWILVVGE